MGGRATDGGPLGEADGGFHLRSVKFVEEGDHRLALRTIHASEGFETRLNLGRLAVALFQPCHLLFKGGLTHQATAISTQQLAYFKIAIHASSSPRLEGSTA